MSNHRSDAHIPFDADRSVNDPVTDGKSSDPGWRRPDTNGRSELDDFLDLVDRYENRLRSVVARLLDDPRDIDEAVQDTFVQAWRHRSAFRSDSAVFTWLYRIATNTALMRLRRRRIDTRPVDDLPRRDDQALAVDPLEGHAERIDRIDEVRSALAELPEHHRIVVMLRDVEGHTNAEVAELLGLPVTTIKAHLHRGRRHLRRLLNP